MHTIYAQYSHDSKHGTALLALHYCSIVTGLTTDRGVAMVEHKCCQADTIPSQRLINARVHYLDWDTTKRFTQFHLEYHSSVWSGSHQGLVPTWKGASVRALPVSSSSKLIITGSNSIPGLSWASGNKPRAIDLHMRNLLLATNRLGL